MRIVLARHGKPDLRGPPDLHGAELALWIRRYDAAGIDPSLPPPEELRQQALDVGRVATSDLRRTVESARLLAPRRRPHRDRVFREAALPEPPFGLVRLRPATWGAMMRAAWFLGWSPRVEPLADARARARRATGQLVAMSRRHQSVLLVGHGIFNALIAWELCNAGWSGPRFFAGGYWTWAAYERQ